MKVARGNIHEYLAINLYYSVSGIVKIHMEMHIIETSKEFPEEITLFIKMSKM
jgi:hypothetical protein